MAEYVTQYIKIEDLSKGMNVFDSSGKLPDGFYEDAQNMFLTNKTPRTCGGLTKLTQTAAPRNEVVVWAEPYTTSEGRTELLATTNAGIIYRYVIETDTWETLYQGLATDALLWTHVPFRGKMVFTNGTDPIYKYDGSNVIPVGGLLVADMETDESWAGTFSRPGTTNYKKRRTLLSSIAIRGNQNAVLTFKDDDGVATAQDFLTGINGAPDFAATDHFKMWVYKDPKKPRGKIRIRFIETAAKYFTATKVITQDGWNQISLLRSDFVLTSTPVWSNITKFQLFVDTGQEFIFDQAWWEYENKPPDGKYVELYQQQLIVAGIEADPVLLQYSDAGSIDYFDPNNTARFSGGRHALEKTDQITGLRSYFDELIVGKVNSAWTFSGTGTNVSISALPLTLGIDGHRAIAETPWSLQYSFENNIFGARLTSRGLVSTNINDLLEDVDGDNLDKIVTIRHDRTHTIRWSFRTLDAVGNENDLGLIYDYQLDAWPCRYTPHVAYYTRGIVDGRREVLVVQYDGYVRRADVGTDFDGTPIESSVTLSWQMSDQEGKQDKVVRWMDGTFYLAGTADVIVEARFADHASQFDSAVFSTFGTITATPNGDKGYVSFGRTSRWMQVRLRATSGAFEVQPPVLIGYADTMRRI